MSTEAAPRSAGLAVYYGYGLLERLAHYHTVVVQPGAYGAGDILWLRERGVRVLAYLSLSEEAATEVADWHLPGVNPAWGTRRVRPGHVGWQARVLEQVRALSYFDGFLLDTLEPPQPGARDAMLALVAGVRREAGVAYLLANRGASLLPELGRWVNGVLIEALSTTWEAGYAAHSAQGLEYTAALLREVRRCGLDAWGLDYADRRELELFAWQRAGQLEVPTFVSTRNLDVLPEARQAAGSLI